ncbi:MAG: septum formation protein Maf [Sphingomonas sp.]|nr:septum formation protein Maf [Sphingomonas sp.]
MPLLLASSSAIRHSMLDAAGVAHAVTPADIDEAAVKSMLGGDPAGLALELAKTKAEAISSRHPDEWVIGSDSVVTVEGRTFDKPKSREAAADHLRFFSGKPMQLISAVALARGGATDWCHGENATLRVRSLSDDFIADYLDREWPAVSHCVGVFRLEGPGVQLFDTIDGDHFTILGMPLLPLLGALRKRGLLAA